MGNPITVLYHAYTFFIAPVIAIAKPLAIIGSTFVGMFGADVLALLLNVYLIVKSFAAYPLPALPQVDLSCRIGKTSASISAFLDIWLCGGGTDADDFSKCCDCDGDGGLDYCEEEKMAKWLNRGISPYNEGDDDDVVVHWADEPGFTEGFWACSRDAFFDDALDEKCCYQVHHDKCTFSGVFGSIFERAAAIANGVSEKLKFIEILFQNLGDCRGAKAPTTLLANIVVLTAVIFLFDLKAWPFLRLTVLNVMRNVKRMLSGYRKPLASIDWCCCRLLLPKSRDKPPKHELGLAREKLAAFTEHNAMVLFHVKYPVEDLDG